MTTVSSDLLAYRLEILHFLQTVAVKSSWLVEQANLAAEAKGYVTDQTDPASWKYYRNLMGEYHPADELMTVVSLDTQETIAFTTANLAIHSRTAAVYRPGHSEYDGLCEKYPHQLDLIRGIVFPLSDVTQAIAADDLSLLGYGRGYLEDGESDVLVDALKRHLDYLADRWNLDFLNHEIYYYPTFWTLLWQSSAAALFAARIQYIHTAYAHSFHIWEYLTSNGIGDYRDILSRRAALFLYRNFRYIKANRGKQKILTLLVNKLLKEMAVGLVGKTLYMQTKDGAEECRWIAELVSETVPTEFAGGVLTSPTESISDITFRLFASGDETSTAALYIDRITKEISATPYNSLPTKLLELSPLILDKKYSNYLYNFILDTMMTLVVAGRYTASIDLVEEHTGTHIQLATKDALVLYHYAACRSLRQRPSELPRRYWPLASYKLNLDPSTIPRSLTVEGRLVSVRSHLDIPAFIAGSQYPLAAPTTGPAFQDLVATMFPTLLKQLLTARTQHGYLALKATQAVFDALVDQDPYAITLAPEADYASWLSRPGKNYAAMVATLDAASDAERRYSDLADAIMAQLIPLSDERLLQYATTSAKAEFYARLKALFIQLCSYNVEFLDTQRANEHWLMSSKLALDLQVGDSAVVHDSDPSTDTELVMSGQRRLDRLIDHDVATLTLTTASSAESCDARLVTEQRRRADSSIVVEVYDHPTALLPLASRSIASRYQTASRISLPTIP